MKPTDSQSEGLESKIIMGHPSLKYPYGSGLCPSCAEVVPLRSDRRTLRKHGPKTEPCSGDGWEKFAPPPPPKPPQCDLCNRAAKWRHPMGGLRCGTCPRPTS